MTPPAAAGTADAPRSAAFDEAWYLAHYPDVAAAVAAGAVASGYAHWVNGGRAEARVAPPGFGGTGFGSTGGFDEAAYLAANPDVATAVDAGTFASGQEHYAAAGLAEGRPLHDGAAVTTSRIDVLGSALFDEAWYLDQNRDVAAAIASGVVPSAYQHWIRDGRAEGRSPPPGFDENILFDAAFYQASYPDTAEELAAGKARNAQHHYATIGRFRGYLPNGFARRPENPAAMPRFGGLWTDAANAPDLVDGKLATGQVTAEQADLLTHWVRYGYVILPHALPGSLTGPAAAVLKGAFAGAMPAAWFDCPAISGYHPVPWAPDLPAQPARALDLHWLSAAVRDLVFAAPLRSFLELVFERRIVATRSYGVLHGFPQDYHRDTANIPFSVANQSAACWIALEDTGGNGITCFPGSHRLPDQLLGGAYQSLDEAARRLPAAALRAAARDQPGRLLDRVKQAGLQAQHIRPRTGEVLVWNANLVHGGLRMSTHHPCASLTTHYCPQGIVPTSFERTGGATRRYAEAGHEAGQYSSDAYRD